MPEEYYPNELIVDLNSGKRFKESLKLLNGAENSVTFIDAQKEQIIFSEKGNNIIITAYETAEVAQWQCVEYVGNPIWVDEKQQYRFHQCLYNITNDKHVLLEDLGYTYAKNVDEIDLSTKTYYAYNKYQEPIGLVNNTSVPESTASGTIVANTNFVIGTVTLTNGASLKNDYTLNVILKDKDGNIKYNYDFVNDNIVLNAVHAGNSYTGSWFNEKAVSTYAGETFNLGGGINTITFDMSKKQGKDTLILTKGGTYNLDYENMKSTNNSYSIKGKDLIIKTDKLINGAWTDYGQLTIKNYFTLGEYATITSTEGGYDEDAVINILNKNYNKKNEIKSQKITDTFLNETIYGGEGNDTINSVGGDDVITGGKGNDKMSLSGGTKTLYYSQGDGNDVITAAKGTTLEFLFKGTNIYVDYEKKGNDLLIKAKESVSALNYVYTATIKNYFKTGADISIKDSLRVKTSDIVNYLNNTFYNKSYLTKAQTITDTFLDGEIIYGGLGNDKINIIGGSNTIYGDDGNDKITVKCTENDTNKVYAGDGNDTITSNSSDVIYGGAGNDKITSSGGDTTINSGADDDTITLSNGIKKLMFYSGDGHDFISIGKNTEVKMYFDQGKAIDGLIFSRNGNNLIIYRQAYIENDIPIPDMSDSVTIKNAFTGDYDITLNYRQGTHNLEYKLNTANLKVRLYGDDNKKNVITGSINDDSILTGKMTTAVNAGEGNNSIYQTKDGSNLTITAGTGNDTYYINDLTKTVTINDLGGEDEIIFTDSELSERHFFFDININTKNGQIKSYGTNLEIIYKNNEKTIEEYISDSIIKNKITVTPAINIENYFTKTGENGSGFIEVLEGADTYNFNEVRENVAGWLYEKGYSSVNQFLTKGAGDNTEAWAKELFGIYDNGFTNQE